MSPKATGTDSFTEKVTKLVEEAKLNTQWRKQFMEWEREMARKFREGKEEGVQQKKPKKMPLHYCKKVTLPKRCPDVLNSRLKRCWNFKKVFLLMRKDKQMYLL